jgi:ABC-type bacteriocin/lantibiotic exporter with double-glycine peptidase domain
MSQIQPLPLLLKRIWSHLSLRRKRQFILLLCLMLLVSFAEVANVGSVIPFLGVLVAPEKVFNSKFTQPFIDFFGFTSPGQLLLPICVGFGVITVLTNVMRMLLLWATTKLSMVVGTDLSMEAYRRSLYQPYSVHISRNTSFVKGGIGKIPTIVDAISYLFILVGSAAILSAILLALLIVNPLIAIICFGGFGLLYAIIIMLTRKELQRSSLERSAKTTVLEKILSESFGGIRDIIIGGTQELYCKIFGVADASSRKAQAKIIIISGSPRFLMESLSILIILFLAYFLSQRPQGVMGVLPILGAIGLGAQRLLPVLQAAYGSWSAMQGILASLQDALDLLDQPLSSYAHEDTSDKIPFNKKIFLENVSFKYGENLPNVLNNINLTIPKGARVGVIGKTGEGKSTLLDVLMGLLLPSQGSIIIDDVALNVHNYRQWQQHIAHVPQAIYLADVSVAENIAFGVPRESIDMERVIRAAKQAQISDVINALECGYDTLVGERGIKLSGGQRQRIGIARALYKDADVVIFDEATSALDSETETAVMEQINSLDKHLTLIIIAHRKSTLEKCDLVIELGTGGIRQIADSMRNLR